MRTVLFVVLLALSSTACSFFGYVKQPKLEWAPPEEARRLQYPSSWEGATVMEGPAVLALDTALKHYFSHGVESNTADERLARCLSQPSTYEVSIKKGEGGIFYVFFFPSIERCGLTTTLLDVETVYAIDEQGRIVGIK
ncbi:lipoprotein [Myxococcus stipitatus DSM 14675]|uniref:Lipoprotein n=1 Tax=Myxococcus stipitatus (strain DSM 14675 / JCM 12634 / Mx s8) TaxID=1278073 RepID=L7ULQ8_MYXSD|nr:hypothetical protein [Myxococcus stipitatus]AGC48923.1 lipoprotein [Myxococcus stipitatus DSM 14675]